MPPSRTRQLPSSSVIIRAPLDRLRLSAITASPRPVILRSTASRCSWPRAPSHPAVSSRPSSRVRGAFGSVTSRHPLQPVVLDLERLLEQVRRARLEIGELRRLDPGAVHREAHDLEVVLDL